MEWEEIWIQKRKMEWSSIGRIGSIGVSLEFVVATTGFER
jgi:hypothetical protein